MQHIRRFSNLIGSRSLSDDIWRTLALFIIISLLFFSNKSLALTANPGATCQGIIGAAQGSFLNEDYTNLVAANNTINYVTITGNASGMIPLEVKMSTTESNTNTIKTNFNVISPNIDGKNISAINVARDFPSILDSTTITLNFRNNVTKQPIYLSNVAISAFDIDYSNTSNTKFDDLIQIKGTNQSNDIISGTFKSVPGSNIVDNNGLNIKNNTNCTAKGLETLCQGSIQFSEPVDKVIIRYTNNSTYIIGNPTTQEIDFRIDNYCYKSSTNYTFTGFVFNDNGGVLRSNIEPKTKFDISSTFTGNSSYFNGIFDRSNEVGIGTTSGLSVSLTDCKGSNISTITSNTNPQTNLNSPLGQFKFTVPANAIANLPVKEVCLMQTEPDPWTFSVDTTPNIRKIDLTKNPNRFDYKTDDLLNLDFGEVETDYASLVLVKSQYVNNCDINANYDGTNGTSSQTPSFSTDSITNIEPGKCIAYRIEAYNRGHVDLKDIRISDELQTKAQGGLVNSVFAFPAPKGDPTSLYTRTTLPTDTITSELFKLDKPTGVVPTKATLYFNTKYGITVDP